MLSAAIAKASHLPGVAMQMIMFRLNISWNISDDDYVGLFFV